MTQPLPPRPYIPMTVRSDRPYIPNMTKCEVLGGCFPDDDGNCLYCSPEEPDE